MRPKWTPNAPQRVPWRPPSDPWAPKAVLGCFLGSFWTPKSSNMELKFDQQSSVYLEVSFWLFGGLWGSFGARFGGHFGLHFGLPGASCHVCKKLAPRHSESTIFRCSGGPKMSQKWNHPAATWLQERLGSLPGYTAGIPSVVEAHHWKDR